MNLASMTGFARESGYSSPYHWAWEVKSVNAKGLDLRLRLPAGFDLIEPEVRARIAAKLARGACHASLSVQRETMAAEVRINHALLGQLATALAETAARHNLAPASMDALLAMRGIVEINEAAENENQRAAACAAMLAGLEVALDHLVAMRAGEGAALAQVLNARCAAIARLADAADHHPARLPQAIAARLAQSVAILAGASAALDPQRLHQEALLLAAKGDIREELDRLATHAGAAQVLIAGGGPCGRRLDFLAQELAREANTLCAKANDGGLTAIGLELRVEIEQMREQIQNIE